MRRVVPSITTHGLTSSSWESKIEELRKLKLKQVGLFLTGLDQSARFECYRQLSEVRQQIGFSIPFVHAVADMSPREYEILINKFDTEQFNLHPTREFQLLHELPSDIKSRISIENSNCREALVDQDLEGFAGICVDLTHLMDTSRINPELYQHMIQFIIRNEVCANHISAIRIVKEKPLRYLESRHIADSNTSFSYLSKLPRETLSDLCAIELENSLTEQLAVLSQINTFLQMTSWETQNELKVS